MKKKIERDGEGKKRGKKPREKERGGEREDVSVTGVLARITLVTLCIHFKF